MAKVIPIGEPVNDAERHAIATLRDHLPASYLILHNFEIRRQGDLYEIDVAVIAPHAVYLVDIKGTRGLIDVYGPKWYPEGRQPFTSPLLKLHAHARSIKGVITASQPGRRDLEGIYVDATILLTAPDATLVDQVGEDARRVTTLKTAAAFFQNAARIPPGWSKNISALHPMVVKALQRVAKPRTGPLRFGNWEVLEKLGGTDAYTEYRGFNLFAGQRASALLRAYQADPYLPSKEEREAQRHRISNAYRALNSMPGHPCIAGARDFFATETEDKYVLVTEDVPGQALRLHLAKPTLFLTFDQKTRIAGDLLSALVHLEAYKVVHRNITPSTMLIGSDGRTRLIGFDFARSGTDRSRSIADKIIDDLEPAYMAPEVNGEPAAATVASDVFSAGLVLYELFTGQKPFSGPTEVFDRGAIFGIKPSTHRPELPNGTDEWLQGLCAFLPGERPSAVSALAELKRLLAPKPSEVGAANAKPIEADPVVTEPAPQLDYNELAPNTQISPKYLVERRLGKPGAFGVAYKVIDTLGDVSRVMKLILRDRHSTIERLKKEYRTLLPIPEHPNVVKVIDADFLPSGGPPFIIFEYIEGLDVGEMIEGSLFGPEDALELGRQVITGLVHLHQHGVFHCDIKPRNLLWTDHGAKIIDFNVSVLAGSGNGHGGGSRRYLPPDLDLEALPNQTDHADRDLYALGLTLYEAVTGCYPWDTAIPPPGKPAKDPRDLPNLTELAPELARVMLKSIAPKRADRFPSALAMKAALATIPAARRTAPVVDGPTSWAVSGLTPREPLPPNTNPYVRHLLTLYSQSTRTNAGTRGFSEQTYVNTALDRELVPAVLSGELKLVIISGNAGDGKTAFLQKLEHRAKDEGAVIESSLPNGSRFAFRGRHYLSNYDGSQDEGQQQNDDVLKSFFAPFTGVDPSVWPADGTRMIAINEGRLVDFVDTHQKDFAGLAAIVHEGLASGSPKHGVAVVNLNLRSVVTDPAGLGGSILEGLVNRMAHESFWRPCHACDLRDRCYVFHNARTLQDETAGPKVTERLKTLYTLTHLRGRLHITLRDLQSALAFTLAGTRDCDEIHELYRTGRHEEIVDGFYFNSWLGGRGPIADRLLSLLREVDVAQSDDPRLDRTLDFVSPDEDRSLFRFERRGTFDREILKRLFEELPRDSSGNPSAHRAEAHRRFIGMARRRSFFERRDNLWRSMLPYKTADQMLAVVLGQQPPEQLLEGLLHAINRGEGLSRPERLGNNLALEVRRVEGGSIRSYRLYPRERFSLALKDDANRARFVEHAPTGLVLRYAGNGSIDAELLVTLDIFEMLQRLNDGYRPSVEEEQGYYLSLSVFKNLLGSAPYQEVLLTTSGHDFYRIKRQVDGRLEMNRVQQEMV